MGGMSDPTDTEASGAKPAEEPARVRTPQAERSEQSRAKAIDAAIASLAEDGYAATTVFGVAKRAKISRGGVLHHFDGKADLLEAVAREAIVRLTAKRKRSLGRIPEGVQRFTALTDATWANMREPESIAILEILIGSRSDPEIEKRMRPVFRDLNAFQNTKAKDIGRRAGLHDGPTIEAMNKLHTAAMRGLLLESIFFGTRADTEEAFALLKWYKSKLVERMIDEAKQS